MSDRLLSFESAGEPGDSIVASPPWHSTVSDHAHSQNFYKKQLSIRPKVRSEEPNKSKNFNPAKVKIEDFENVSVASFGLPLAEESCSRSTKRSRRRQTMSKLLRMAVPVEKQILLHRDRILSSETVGGDLTIFDFNALKRQCVAEIRTWMDEHKNHNYDTSRLEITAVIHSSLPGSTHVLYTISTLGNTWSKVLRRLNDLLQKKAPNLRLSIRCRAFARVENRLRDSEPRKKRMRLGSGASYSGERTAGGSSNDLPWYQIDRARSTSQRSHTRLQPSTTFTPQHQSTNTFSSGSQASSSVAPQSEFFSSIPRSLPEALAQITSINHAAQQQVKNPPVSPEYNPPGANPFDLSPFASWLTSKYPSLEHEINKAIKSLEKENVNMEEILSLSNSDWKDMRITIGIREKIRMGIRDPIWHTVVGPAVSQTLK